MEDDFQMRTAFGRDAFDGGLNAMKNDFRGEMNINGNGRQHLMEDERIFEGKQTLMSKTIDVR